MIVSTKKNAKHQTFDSWFPYYAGYPQNFIESVIRFYKIKHDSLIYDPWAGSGTTLHTSALYGIASIGVDVNPFAVDLSNAKSPIITKYAKFIVDFYENFLAEFLKEDHPQIDAGTTELIDYFNPDSSVLLIKIMSAIENFNISVDSIDELQIIRSFLRASVILSALKYSQKKNISNPTWQIGINRAALPDNFLEISKDKALSMAKNISDYYMDHLTSNYITKHGDSRFFVPEDKANYVITSPPYLTRIDYIVNTRIALSFYQLEDKIRSLRESSMGTPVIRKTQPSKKTWGSYATEILELISQHPSKASGTYYKKTYSQYISDMYNSILSITDSTTENGTMIFVVQPSYYKDIFIDLSRLYIEAFETMGIKGDLLSRNESKRNMSSINSNSNKYNSDKKYHEDVLVFRK